MRRFLFTFTLISGFAFLINAQSAALQNQIAADKNELELEGYTFIDGGDWTTNIDWDLAVYNKSKKKAYTYAMLYYMWDFELDW